MRCLLRALFVGAIALLAAGCRPASDDPASAIQRIVLISIDTLRADALGCYGNPHGTSPYIDELAAQGTRFANCIAPAPMTLPSHASMLTGLHPLQHGLLINMQGKLPASVVTLAERLKALGWRTGAVVSSAVLHRRFDLDQGFDEYRDDFYPAVAGFDEPSVQRTNARATTSVAVDWLNRGSADQKEFLFVHYIDAHSPYDPPPDLARRFDGDLYLGEIAFVDRQVARLVDHVVRRFSPAGTLWIVTSDHGEALGEHGEATHGTFLYDEVVRVPLIFAGPGVPRGLVVTEPVGLVDLVPTLLALIGAEPDASLAGRAVPAGDDQRTLISTSYIGQLGFGWSPLWSLGGNDERFILSPDPEYYRIDVDPDEADNLFGQEPGRAGALEAALRERAAEYLEASHDSERIALGEVSRLQLAALGYAEPSSSITPAALDDFSGKNPREMQAVIARMSEYSNAIARGDLETASHAIEEALRINPENQVLAESRGRLLIERGRADEFLAGGARLQPEIWESRAYVLLRAHALRNLERPSEAADLLQRNLVRDADDLETLTDFAAALLLAERNTEALAAYERLVTHDPRSTVARINLANLLTKAGHHDLAASHLETLLAFAAGDAKGHNNLGIVYAKLGRFDEAITHLERSLELLGPGADSSIPLQMIEALRNAPTIYLENEN